LGNRPKGSIRRIGGAAAAIATAVLMSRVVFRSSPEAAMLAALPRPRSTRSNANMPPTPA
jgi:hypothetical protein